ncbi:hypothetical protein HYPSUDRAFT_207275 [Hypholoma sublateritium FD-334 SS-4]|uniref:Uncharacterized protein n=1 Tax=Hypholoma sublateritium (strain FD-334 SS-4) TaxID=945553 RepID=A0A0D2LYZ9_HYPSF|nr:hypothetical protein HYPSUDRAFT_207275 [Hypholoma sublateritium FD-334 SS-4]
MFTAQEWFHSICSSARTYRRVTPTPPVAITTKLPCTLDQDLDELPLPNYTPQDIARVQRILLNFVPTELADAILDMAEYWPYVDVSRNDFSTSYSALDGPDQNAQWCYMVSPKVPSVERNGIRVPTTVKKVKFTIKAYESAWGKPAGAAVAPMPSKSPKTWFEASILKKGESAEFPDYKEDVRPNNWFAKLASHPKYLNEFRDADCSEGEPRVENPFDAKRRWYVANSAESNADKRWHETVWKHDDKKANVEVDPESGNGSGSGFLDSLSVDDRIVLMMRAPAPGLISTVFNVKLEVYYALSSSYL